MPTLKSYNPSTGSIVGEVPITDPKNIPEMVENSRNVLPLWKRLGHSGRSELLTQAYKDIKAREEELASKEKQLKTLEAAIRKDLGKIEKALKESKEQFGLKENQIKKNVDSLIKVYSTMKPAEAANLIAAIDQHLALQIISGMKSKVAGQVLSQLDVKVAKAITEKLAGKIAEKADDSKD